MKASVQISRGIESLFGTRDENIRLIESGLNVRIRLLNDSLEIEGEDADVARAAGILDDYVALTRDPVAARPSRVLAQPTVSKVEVTAKLCTEAGVTLVRVPRRAKAHYALARRWCWGDAVVEP